MIIKINKVEYDAEKMYEKCSDKELARIGIKRGELAKVLGMKKEEPKEVAKEVVKEQKKEAGK
jgi:hypothetical protein